jgi:hypothetical protein
MLQKAAGVGFECCSHRLVWCLGPSTAVGGEGGCQPPGGATGLRVSIIGGTTSTSGAATHSTQM